MDPVVTLNRKTNVKGGDRLEQEGYEFHREVYQGYMKLLKMYPENTQIIDATQSIKEVFSQSIYHIENILKEKEGQI